MDALTVGVPTEVKAEEHRVAITPDGVRELLHAGAAVLVQSGAGADSSIPDDDYRRAGATIVTDAAEVWERADLVCKVKEPLESEFVHFRDGLVLFTYLHLAAYPAVADALLDAGVTGIAYETVQLPDGSLPLLAPMSEVAGRMSVQIGAHFLERHNGGRGVLLGGAPGVRPARVVVLGAGNVGWNAAWMAAGLEAEVDLLDKSIDRLRHVDQIQMGRITTLSSNRGAVERCVAEADLVIGAVLVPGGRAPVVVSEDMVRSMRPRRRGHRHRHRPGRLRRDQPRDHPRRSDVPGPRRRALRGGQHARGGPAHLHPRADQRDAPLPHRARPSGGPGRGATGSGPGRRDEHARRARGEPHRRRRPRTIGEPARRLAQPAVIPLSTLMTAPCMFGTSSDATNANSRANSSASAMPRKPM